MTELHAVWVATVFAADTKFDAWAGSAAFLDGDFHELANAGGVETCEGVLLEDLCFGVRQEEITHVIAADAESGLGKVVGAEAEELRR